MRRPEMIGPRWQELSLAPEVLPQFDSFHASLLDCVEKQVEQRTSHIHDASSSCPPPSQLQRPGPNALARAWSWLRTQQAVSAANRAIAAASPGSNLSFMPKPIQPPRPHSGKLAHAMSWLREKYTLSATKRLRVAEVVSLGEKRFVAVVSLEGREFLIGGGASGVSLLTQLETAREPADALQPKFGVQGESE